MVAKKISLVAVFACLMSGVAFADAKDPKAEKAALVANNTKAKERLTKATKGLAEAGDDAAKKADMQKEVDAAKADCKKAEEAIASFDKSQPSFLSNAWNSTCDFGGKASTFVKEQVWTKNSYFGRTVVIAAAAWLGFKGYKSLACDKSEEAND